MDGHNNHDILKSCEYGRKSITRKHTPQNDKDTLKDNKQMQMKLLFNFRQTAATITYINKGGDFTL